MLAAEVLEKIYRLRPEAIHILSSLVAIPSVNPPGSACKECADFLAKLLSRWGIEHKIVRAPGNNSPHDSIIGPRSRLKSLHLHGHYDVVPGSGPRQFEPRLTGDRLYGRGSSDMKGGLVAILLAIRFVREFCPELKDKVTFSLVPDEESGGRLGTQYLMSSGALPYPSLGMLMPEPTSRAIWNANKGALSYRITVLGKSAHVGLAHQGINAFEQMVEIAHSFLNLKTDIENRRTRFSVHPPSARRSVMLLGGESGSGINFNVVPETSFFTIDRRLNPEENLQEAKQEVEEILDRHRKRGTRVRAEIIQEGESSLANPQNRLEPALQQAIKEIMGKKAPVELCPGLCEIRFFNKRGIPAYAYGPGLLEVSHGPAEYVRISDILDCATIYVLTARELFP
jgi:acetylornithine deacetylase/succinyl-diaminopimelate desuccinylase family protein